jgi:hypothetical protein
MNPLSIEEATKRLLEVQHIRHPSPNCVENASVFLTNVSLKCLLNTELQQQLIDLMRHTNEYCSSLWGLPAGAVDWDQVMAPGHEIDGFGAQGGQLYIKSGLAVSSMHDEMLWWVGSVSCSVVACSGG